MDFKKYLEVNAHQVDQILEQILSEFLSEVKKDKPKLLPFALGLINSCKGGKRIRGVLVKLGYELVRPVDVEILRISAAIEILHAALLIHDDVIDQSPTRRGQPTLYKALSHPKDVRVAGDHYGISQAISIGDIGLYLPIKIISGSNFDNDLKIKVLSLLSKTVIDTGWGQILDVEKPGWKDRSPDEANFINLFKTAKYTIAGPLQLGAILAGAEEELLGRLGLFGENLGIAFQIQDDILDGEVESADDAQAKALEYVSKAKQMIPEITSNDKMRKLLEEMAEYMVVRTK